ncbi:MAG: hypothetical protein IJ518_05800 [Clostridia bacterium]|nr:hypothetical protein [Clostridia bacterium]
MKNRILIWLCIFSGMLLLLWGCGPVFDDVSVDQSTDTPIGTSVSTTAFDNQGTTVGQADALTTSPANSTTVGGSTTTTGTSKGEDTTVEGYAFLRPASVFADGMVLQQSAPVPVWGQGEPGKTVIVTLKKSDKTVEQKSATVGKDKLFYVELSSVKGSFDAYTLTISCDETNFEYEDVLFGDVFLAAGQSNMVLSVRYCADRNQTLKEATNPYLRFARVYRMDDGVHTIRQKQPQETADVTWVKGNNKTAVDEASALAYHFIRNIYLKTGEKYPVAFVDISYGGVPIETFLSRSQLDSLPKSKKILAAEGWTYSRWGTHGTQNHMEPTGLYNERVYPIRHLKFKGMIWYQGESNLGTQEKCDAYIPAFEALCKGFGELFGMDGKTLPTVYAMLAPFNYAGWGSGISLGLPQFWEAQHKSALVNHDTMREVPIYDLPLDYIPTEVPDEYMVGAVFDPIHPIHKIEVAQRMATAAMDLIYKSGSRYIPPYPTDYTVEGNRLIVEFASVTPLRTINGKTLRGFSICGADRRFVAAKAELIGGNKVAVYADGIASPVAVTYAFTDLNNGANLCDSSGLPAVPFRSDTEKSQYNLDEIKK